MAVNYVGIKIKAVKPYEAPDSLHPDSCEWSENWETVYDPLISISTHVWGYLEGMSITFRKEETEYSIFTMEAAFFIYKNQLASKSTIVE